MKGQIVGFVRRHSNIFWELRARYLLVCIALLSIVCPASAQSEAIEGRVTSAGQAVQGASVSAYDVAQGRIVEFVETDTSGGFRLSKLLQRGKKGIRLDVRRLGYKTQKILLDSVGAFPIHIVLTEQATLLGEVTVKAPKAWGGRDTINYSVARLKRLGDRTIGDVLRNIPGVKVNAGGSVEYQGKGISMWRGWISLGATTAC